MGANRYLSIQLKSFPVWYQIDSGWWGTTYMVTGAGIMVVVGLQGDDEVFYLGANGGKTVFIYIASIPPDLGSNRWLMVEF